MTRSSAKVVHFIAGMCVLFALGAPATAFGQVQNLTLAWDASATPNISGYYVYAGTSSGVYNLLSQVVVPAGQKTYAFAATPGVKYYFAVSAFLSDGTEGTRSSEITGGIPTLSQPANQSGTVGTAITALQLTASDPDGNGLQFSGSGLPAGLALSTTTGRITGTPTIAGTYTVTVGVTDGVANIQQRFFTWTIGSAAASVTVSTAAPSTGTGASQIFTLTYTDSLGATDLASASVLFNATLVATPANSCLVTFNATANLVSLMNDAGTSWSSGTIGDATTLQNAQCSLTLASSTATRSANNLVLSLPMTFNPLFDGAKNVYLYGASNGGQNSGWIDRGNWTVPAATLSAVSVSPASGSGSAQTFTLQYSDTAGAADLKTAWAWFTTSSTASTANSCITYYEQATDTVYLLNDAGSSWLSARRGTSTALQNTQCAVSASGTTRSVSGNALTVNLPVTFSSSFSGAKNTFLYAVGSNGNSGWQDRGDWTIPTMAIAVTADSVTPGTGTGTTATFALQFSDTAGASDLKTAWAWFTPTLASSSANSCMTYYDQSTDRVYLLDDAGTTWGSAARGSSTPLQNAQCSVAMSGVTRTAAANVVTINLPVTFSDAFAGTRHIYLYGAGGTANSGWQDRGSWTIPAPSLGGGVTADSATPSAGSGSTSTFTLKYTDGLGVADLRTVWAWFSDSLASSTHSCLAYYEKATDRVYLLDDAGTSWLWAQRGSANVLQNSQCAVSAAGVTVTASGNVLTVNMPVTFSASYAGAKNIYLFGAGTTLSSGWQDRGDFTVSAGAETVTADSATPATGTGSSATFTLKYSDSQAATNLRTAWVWISPTMNSTVNSCLIYYERGSNTLYLLNDAGTTWLSAVRGTATPLQNSRCSVSASSTTVSTVGNTLTVNLPVTFSGYSGAKNIYLFGAASDVSSGWQDRGNWNVP